MSITTPSCQLTQTALIRNKSVAEGAVIFRLDHSVSSRVARYTYGVECYAPFDPSLADHLAREDKSHVDSSGEIKVPNYFLSILQKVNFMLLYAMYLLIFKFQQDDEVSEETEFRASFHRVLSKPEFRALKTLSEGIKCYRNRRKSAPAWIDADPCV